MFHSIAEFATGHDNDDEEEEEEEEGLATC
jgi:hypothetical protein